MPVNRRDLASTRSNIQIMIVELEINGKRISASVEPRTHLADLIREHLNLTATHLRCEQGACGACTLLIDGFPARSCIVYAGMCDGAKVTTLEGLEDDATMIALRRAFAEEHGLQCGYCTPGMLVTARDIVLRLPDADERRIRAELSGNLCRCTGYVGIVRAITRILDDQRRGTLKFTAPEQSPLGPLGAPKRIHSGLSTSIPPTLSVPPIEALVGEDTFGLGHHKPNIEFTQSFTVPHSPDEVWSFLADVEKVVSCIPGASLTQPPTRQFISASIAIKLGPIIAKFIGQARVIRDDKRRRAIIMGAGRHAGGSRAKGEAEYIVESVGDSGTQVVLTTRALLVGPLAQFSRGTIVNDIVVRVTDNFAKNLRARMGGLGESSDQRSAAPLNAGQLFGQLITARIKAIFARLSALR
jgi:carbon-monoxide dehydrogenase small subunit